MSGGGEEEEEPKSSAASDGGGAMPPRRIMGVGPHNGRLFYKLDATIDRSKRTPQISPVDRRFCRLCGDGVGFAQDGRLFTACYECLYPICKACYRYERQEGSQVCPRCGTRYLRLKGWPRVAGDAEEQSTDDLESEFGTAKDDGSVSTQEETESLRSISISISQVPSTVQSTDGEGSEHHASVQSTVGSGVKMMHPLSIVPDTAATKSAEELRPLDPTKEMASYGYGSVNWELMGEGMTAKQDRLLRSKYNGAAAIVPSNLSLKDEGRQPFSRKVPLPLSMINPYRMIIMIRLVSVVVFLHYRVTHPEVKAYTLWLTAVICEIWFGISWVFDQFPKWSPIERETYLNRLSSRYERHGGSNSSDLSAVDVFVSTVDPTKEPPLVTANTVLSVLAVDYPTDKVSCYVSDDGAAMLTFEVMSEISMFAKKWVPFCKRFDIQCRAPESYFTEKVDYLKDKIDTSFIKARREMKNEYGMFKVRVNALVARAAKVPEEGWAMQDGKQWPGNNAKNHPVIIQIFLGVNGESDEAGNTLPRLVYVSREKRFGVNHHKKAGAMNALVRTSAVLSNAPYILNLDCDHYINNCKAIREAMCFMMDPLLQKKVCFVQFPQRFDGIDVHDRYANRNIVFFDINMKGLDGIQGPVYVGTGCVFRRQALYGYDAPKTTDKVITESCTCLPKWLASLSPCCCKARKKNAMSISTIKKKRMIPKNPPPAYAPERKEDDDVFEKLIISQQILEKKFGISSVFIDSTLRERSGGVQKKYVDSDIQEAIYVVRCEYEDKTDWGREVGWIYGSVTEDILTGFKMHCHGWRSIYCMPKTPAFVGTAPLNLSDRLTQVHRWGLGSMEIFLSRHCPIWYGYDGGLKILERVSYINAVLYPWTSIPLIVYCTLPGLCLLTQTFITPVLSLFDTMCFFVLFLCIVATALLEMRWSGVGFDEWWRNEQFWVIGGVSSHFFAVIQGLLKVIGGIETNFTVTAKSVDDDDSLAELYMFKWTTLLIPPMVIGFFNVFALIIGIVMAISIGMTESIGTQFGRFFFAVWVLAHLYPFFRGLVGRVDRVPALTVFWVLAFTGGLAYIWVSNNPFGLFPAKSTGPKLVECGLECDDGDFLPRLM